MEGRGGRGALVAVDNQRLLERSFVKSREDIGPSEVMSRLAKPIDGVCCIWVTGINSRVAKFS